MIAVIANVIDVAASRRMGRFVQGAFLIRKYKVSRMF